MDPAANEFDYTGTPKVYTIRKIYTDSIIRTFFRRKVYNSMHTLQADLNVMLNSATPAGPKELEKLQKNYKKINELLEFLDPIMGGAECRKVLDAYEKQVMKEGGEVVVLGRCVES